MAQDQGFFETRGIMETKMHNNYAVEKMAILVDGGFYRRRAFNLFGDKTPEDRANELVVYCSRHVDAYNNDEKCPNTALYRIFYYDCPPLTAKYFSSSATQAHKYEEDQQLQMELWLHTRTGQQAKSGHQTG